MSKPLITFALFAYNQERFIREAVEGAFAQTYSPLEIILSDDCSPDATFRIMQEMAAGYRGRHTVILNRNLTNLGLAGQVNRIMQLTRGELVVAAAGDDVSTPQRVEQLFSTWNAADRPVAVIYSDVMEVAEDGRPLYLLGRDRSVKVAFLDVLEGKATQPLIGCSECWHRRLFDWFGPLAEDVVNEDSAIYYRAGLCGSIQHVHEVLVHHRCHAANLGAAGRQQALDAQGILRHHGENFRRMTCLFRNFLRDLDKYKSISRSNEETERLEKLGNKWLEFSRIAHRLCAETGIRRLRLLLLYLARVPSPAYRRLLATQLLIPSIYLTVKKKVPWLYSWLTGTTGGISLPQPACIAKTVSLGHKIQSDAHGDAR